MAVVDYTYLDLKNPLALKAAGLIAADTLSTAVFVGKGAYWCEIIWTACEIGTGDESYFIELQQDDAASGASAGSYQTTPPLAFGNSSLIGGAAATASTGRFVFGHIQQQDNLVRVATWVTGTIAAGMNFAVNLYPMEQVAA